MKKFLALVLALVMTMSLVTISAGAEDFTDADALTYEEAVDVMTALGVVGGYADGSFNPTAGLTRGAAAKIICNMILGTTTAEALVANDAPFSDVAADNVFAGYIAYCVNEGIISGYADGTFKPAAPLTGYAFMKMLLGALGYDAAIEGYVGTNWSIQVAKRALNIGLDSGLVGDFAGAKALTREEACLYAFNTLKANVVDYDNNSSITVGDIVITNSSKAAPVVNSKNDYRGSAYYGDGKENILQFCEQYFAKLSLAAVTNNYGSAANKWTYKGVTVGSYTGDATIVYTAETKEAVVEAALEDYNNYATGTVTLVENGKSGTIAPSAAAIAAVTGNGTTVEIYVSDNVITKVVVIEKVVAEVTAVSDKNETITLSVKANASTFGDASVTLTTKEGYGDFAKKDLVLVTAYNTSSNDVTGATVTAVEALEEVEGLATKKNSAKATITIDGTVYESAEAIATAKNVANFAVSSKYDATLYLDSYGYVVYAVAGTAATDDTAVAVLKKYQSLNEDGELVWMIKGVTSNGEEVAWMTESEAADGDLNKVRLYADSDDDDKYTLSGIGTTVAKTAGVVNDGQTVMITDTDIAKGAKSLSVDSTKMYFASDLKVIYINDGKSAVKEGVQEMENKITYVVVDVVDEVPYIATMFVLAAAGNTTTDMNDIVLVIGGTTGNYDLIDKDGKAKTFKTYDAYVAGELVEGFYSDDTVASTGFYEIEIDNDNGDYVLTGNEYAAGDKDELSVIAEAEYTALVGDILTAGADFDISGATFVDTTDNGYTSMAEVNADKNDAGNTAVDGAKVVVVYDFDTKVASYVYLTAIIDT